jgi:hypothetical protein
VTAPVEVVTPDDTAALDARATLRTDEMTTAHALPQSRDPLPFRRGDDDPTKQLTYVSRAHGLALDVEEYAALCAERDRAPERQLHIHERYDVVGDRCREGLDRAYQLRFMRDPGLRSLWQQHYVRFSSALRRSR